MTQVYFYHQAFDRMAAVCQLISRFWQQKKQNMLIFTPEPEIADELNRRLWLVPKTSFIPHCFDTMPIAAETPILLSRELQRTNLVTSHPRLLNFSDSIPHNFQLFSSVIEVVSVQGNIAELGRNRVKHYRQAGHSVEFFEFH